MGYQLSHQIKGPPSVKLAKIGFLWKIANLPKIGEVNQNLNNDSLPICLQYLLQNSTKLYKITCTVDCRLLCVPYCTVHYITLVGAPLVLY